MRQNGRLVEAADALSWKPEFIGGRHGPHR